MSQLVRRKRKGEELKLPENAKKFLQQFPGIVNAIRLEFYKMGPDSSVASATGECHIIYFEPFMAEPIVLEGKVEIRPVDWAKAFLHFQLKDIAEHLCRAIFSAEDVLARNTFNDIFKLPSIKRVAVLRAAKWMMDKNRDPWSYNPTESPSEEETKLITSYFESFEIVTADSELMETCGTDTQVTYVAPELNPYDTKMVNTAMEKTFKELDYTQTFTRIIQLSNLGVIPSLGNCAQTASSLTKLTIPHNTDIFVDAVQFSRNRWASAAKSKDISSCADKLFRRYLRSDFKEEGRKFNSFEDVCPVKRLALYRAAKWLMVNTRKCDESDRNLIFTFDSTIPEHNVFPTEAEIMSISTSLSRTYSEEHPELLEEKLGQLRMEDSINLPRISVSRVWKDEPVLFLRVIGRGAFGVVFAASSATKRQQIAIKAISTVQEDNCFIERCMDAVCKLEHPNVVKFFDYWIEKADQERTCSTFYMKMELCDGDLLKLLEQGRAETIELDRFDIIRQLAEGLKYLHSKSILHRDLKPDNILYSTSSHSRHVIKIGDFGFDFLNGKRYGAPTYQSPDLMDETNLYTSSCDVFSLGLIYLEILHNFKTRKELRVTFNLLKFETCNVEHVSSILRNLVEGGELVKPGQAEILWKLLVKMLNIQGSERPSAGQIVAYLKSEEKDNFKFFG